MDSYFEFNKENTKCSFCNELISTYDYPKDKIIEFLIFYIQNRYHLLNNISTFNQKSQSLPPLEKNLFKSYTILFDLWIKSAGPKIKNEKYNRIMKNLYIVNKTYFHHSQTLDPEIFYNDFESIVLNTPMFLHGLMVQNDDDLTSDSDSDISDCAIINSPFNFGF